MLHAGLDLSRKKLDVCLLSNDGEHLDQLAVAPDVDSLSPGPPDRRGPPPARLRGGGVDIRGEDRP
jgi:hypothetical protein